MSRPRQDGPRHIDNDALATWMLLLKEGGYWTAREVGGLLDTAPMLSTVRSQLDRLTSNGMVQMRQAPMKHPSFGVTARCAAPPGYAWMLEEAIAATGPIDWPALEALHA